MKIPPFKLTFKCLSWRSEIHLRCGVVVKRPQNHLSLITRTILLIKITNLSLRWNKRFKFSMSRTTQGEERAVTFNFKTYFYDGTLRFKIFSIWTITICREVLNMDLACPTGWKVHLFLCFDIKCLCLIIQIFLGQVWTPPMSVSAFSIIYCFWFEQFLHPTTTEIRFKIVLFWEILLPRPRPGCVENLR